jgi:chaperone required for assembly of F1-ATPase
MTNSLIYPIAANGRHLQTPGKHPLAVSSKALADAIQAEWQGQQKFISQKMPLTSLAYTAIDKVAGQEGNIIEVMLAYIDTDTLCYRASSPPVLARQQKEWDPVVAWASKEFGATWHVTTGIMPLEQPETLVASVKKYLASLDAATLSTGMVIASIYSSLILALAVLKKHSNAEDAFTLSRMEEDTQAEQWGRDPEAEKRAEHMKAEISSAGRFLRLLECH